MGTAAPASLASTRTGIPDFGAILRFWDGLTALFPDSSALASFLARFQTDPNGSVNWGKVVFLTSCFVTMAGCGILTSLLRRKSPRPSPEIRRRRRLQRRDYSKGSAGTVTSSEEEDDSDEPPCDSAYALTEKGVSSHYEQPDDGMSL